LEKDHIHDLLCNNIRFGRLLEDARLQQLLEPFLGPSFIMYAFTSSSIPPGECNYSARIHVDSPRFQANYITNVGVIWTLDDYLIHNGCLRVLPGSHHSPELPPESYFEQHCQPILCPAGSLILFNARLVHRTGRNESPSWRHSLTMNCCRCFMKQRMDWVRFVPESISGQLNEQARRMLGFDTRLPTTLNELFLPDDQRLYKGGQE
jgi:ectoine hydroxylase-related dioxygenase (phytanoyl-CoA dioxygenase family)